MKETSLLQGGSKPAGKKMLHHRRRRKAASALPVYFAGMLSFFQTVNAQPVPASILQTWTSAGNPLLHIQPSFYQSATSLSTSLLSFKSVFLANDKGIDGWILSDSFEQDVSGMQVPNLAVDSQSGVTVFSRPREINFHNGTDTGEMWAMTYPLDCKTVKNSTVADYTIYKAKPGQAQWEGINVTTEDQNPTSWKPTGRYLGRGFANSVSSDGIEHLYSFGGLCLGKGAYHGDGKNDSFSAGVWRIENTTTAVTTTTTTTDVQERDAGDTASSLNVKLAVSKNPPIPEAGFSMLTLPVNKTSEITGSDGMLILGGYTSRSTFVGLGQIAIYSLEDERWNYVPAALKGRSLSARAGHSAVMDEKGEKIILFGGWLENVTQPATPSLLSLKVGNLEGGWEWEQLNVTEEHPGDGPGNISLWGHAATLLEGNVMLLTSGFEIGKVDKEGLQSINDKTFFLNLTSNKWISRYNYPMTSLNEAAEKESERSKGRDIAIIAGVLGGVFLFTVGAIILFCYARRRDDYNDIPTNSQPDGPDSFDSLDLEYGKSFVVDGVPPPPPNNRRTRSSKHRLDAFGRRMTSPDLPPMPEPIKTQFPSHVDVDRITTLQEEQEQRENAVSQGVERRRSVRSDMVAWVREWANADAAAQAAELLRTAKEENGNQQSSSRRKANRQDRKDTAKPAKTTHLMPETARCITSSSMYSDGQVSTLTASEIYDTPVDEVPYPIPPLLLSTAQAYGEQSPRHPRVLVGPDGVTAPLPRKMAEEFPNPTFIPRDSLPESAYGASNYHGSYNSVTQPLLNRDHQSSWQDATPRESNAGTQFYTIPLTTFEESHTATRGKTIEDRVREEMYNPGPARTEDECRLSSIMDYYAESKCPTPIPEQTEEPDEEDDEAREQFLQRSRSPASIYSGDKTTLGHKAKMVVINRLIVDEPVKTPSVSFQNPRESVVAPLLSEQDANMNASELSTSAVNQKGKAAERGASTRSRASLASIKRRAAAVAASLSVPNDRRRSTSVGKPKSTVSLRTHIHRSPGRRKDASETSLLQPHRAEIEHVNDIPVNGRIFPNGDYFDDDIDMDDKVVQVVYTAPKSKLRVVNPSPRRVSSSGTERSSPYASQPAFHSQRRVSSAGATTYGVIANGEAILRLGSTAGRRFGELD